jgi:uncharacterized iron-regulated membrane protein
MTAAQQWLRRPQNLWLRRALFQIHLWTGIGLGIYVVLISVSGSVIVFRNELYKAFTEPVKKVAISGRRLTQEELKAAARRAYPGYSVSFVFDAKSPDQAIEIWMEGQGQKKQRLFDPYTGKDLGGSVPNSIRMVAWLSDLHTNLLYKETGRIVNGLGAGFLTLLSLTGAVIWWPGVRKWRRSLTIRPQANWKKLNWDLHSAVGFWTLSFVFMWGFTGVYVVWPTPFQRAINRFAPLEQYRLEPLAQSSFAAPSVFVPVADQGAPPPRRVRPPRHFSFGDKIIRWLTWLHFGNFAGWKVKAVWAALGLAPPFLFVTGILMWWNRVLSPSARRAKRTVLTVSAEYLEVPSAGRAR